MNTNFNHNPHFNNNQAGATLIMALVVMLVVFGIVTAALNAQRSIAENLDRTAASSQDEWTARAYTSRAAAWAIYKLPANFRRDLAAARVACPDPTLPAFNPRGDIDSLPCVKSLLGSLDKWLTRQQPAAAAFALEGAEDARVGVRFAEAYRDASADGGFATESYTIEYTADAVYGAHDTADRKVGQVVLATGEPCQATAEIVASHSADGRVAITVRYTGVNTLRLFENNAEVAAATVPHNGTAQNYSFPGRTATAGAQYRVEAASHTTGCASSSRTITIPGTPAPEIVPSAGGVGNELIGGQESGDAVEAD